MGAGDITKWAGKLAAAVKAERAAILPLPPAEGEEVRSTEGEGL